MRKIPISTILCIVCFLISAAAQESLRTIRLPRPDTIGGKPLMQVLKERKSTRSFSDKKLPDHVLSNLLWAAFGVNRPDGHRTAPSARNWQEIDIYVATDEGVFLYEARAHALKQILKDDLRAKTGSQDFVARTPVNLIYVADLNKAKAQTADDAALFTGADCGFIAENVYLYCASEGLAVVVRGLVDRVELSKALKLRPEQKILLSQTVGYPQ